MKGRGRTKRAEQTDVTARVRNLLTALIRIQRGILRRLLSRPRIAELTPAQALLSLVEDHELIATILLTIPSAGAMLLTYRGVSIPLSENGAEIAHKGDALVFAASIGVLVWLGWYFLFGVIHRLRGRRLAGALVAGTIYVTTIACIDAPFNMLALGGSSAVQMSLVETVAHYEDARTAAFAKVAASRRLLPGLRAQAESFKASEIKELGGAHSGQPKPGKVSAAFGKVGGLLGKLADELHDGLTAAEGIQADITSALGRMKAATHRQGAIRARVETVSIEADAIDALFGRLAQFDMTVSVKATLKSLETAVSVPKTATKPFEAIQNEQLTMIAANARSVGDILQAALAELATVPTASLAPVRPADPMTAIKTYWQPLLPQWIAALFVDLAPALLLFILIAGRREAEHAEASSPTLGVAT